MIILTRDELTQLHSNQPVELRKRLKAKHIQILESGQHIWRCPYTAGTNVPVFRQPDTGPVGPHVCRATITEIELRDDHWILELRIHRTRTEPARLLARRSDALYTSDPHQALPHEPEAIDQDTQHRYSNQARQRHADFQSAHQAALHEQLQQELARAEALGTDVTHLRLAIEQRVRALKRRNDQAA